MCRCVALIACRHTPINLNVDPDQFVQFVGVIGCSAAPADHSREKGSPASCYPMKDLSFLRK